MTIYKIGIVVLVACLVCQGGNAAALEYEIDTRVKIKRVLLATTGKLWVAVIDEVEDGCLPQPNALKSTAELELRQRGFNITQASVTALYIRALGYRIKDLRGQKLGCVVHLDVGLTRDIAAVVPFGSGEKGKTIISTAIHRYHDRVSLLSSQKSEMQKHLQERVEQETKNVILEILRARDEVFKERPQIKKDFEEYLTGD